VEVRDSRRAVRHRQGSCAGLARSLFPICLVARGVGGAAVLGHMFSPYVSFKGGKGVATGPDVPRPRAGRVLIAIPVWIVCLWLTATCR